MNVYTRRSNAADCWIGWCSTSPVAAVDEMLMMKSEMLFGHPSFPLSVEIDGRRDCSLGNRTWASSSETSRQYPAVNVALTTSTLRTARREVKKGWTRPETFKQLSFLVF